MRSLLIGALLGAAFFGLSTHITRHPQAGAVWIHLPDLQPAFDALQARAEGGRPVLFSTNQRGLEVGPLREAAAAESSWLFVRQSATWANSNSNLADKIIVALKNAGLLANSGTFQTTTVINGVSYKLRLDTGCSAAAICMNKSSTAYTGTKTYANRLKFWRASDGTAALEMLFDNVNSPATGSGVLLLYRLAVLDSTISNNESLIVESYISGGAPSRRQTYSWGSAFWTSGPNAATTSDRGRVVLEEMTIGEKNGGLTAGLCVKIAARTVSFSSDCGTGAHYYALAYGQKTTGNFETTALSGLALGALPASGVSTICGANILQHGIFAGSGFVSDNLASGAIPTGYPDANAVTGYGGVDALYSEVNTAGAGAGGYDDLQTATINGLNAIAFPNADAPPF
ncbi:MAG: hypothetical protein K1X75_12015 [Leptospirales bacterium]|nr:hypothetical protein [Leptospirales bacterium]